MMSTYTSSAGRSLPPRHDRLRFRERKAERRLARLAVFQHDVAGMGLHQPASDRQPQPGAVAGVGRAFDETVEEPFAHRVRHAGTVIDHADRDLAGGFLRGPDRDRRAGRRETVRVIEQVVEDLTETVPVCEHADAGLLWVP